MTFNGINLNNVDDLMNRTYSSKEPCFDYGHNQSRYQDLEAKISLDRRPLRWHSRLAVTIYQQAADDFGKQKFLPASADMGGVHPGNAQSCCYGRRPDVSEHRLNFL